MLQTIEEKIQQRRQQILVHSFLYYQLNTNIVSDHDYDRWSKELADLQREYPEESKRARYYEAFKGFDGSSGFDLPYTDPKIQAIAHQVLREHKKMIEWRNKNA